MIRPPRPECVHDNGWRPTGECGGLLYKILLRFRLVTEIGIAAEVGFASLSYRVVFSITGKDPNKACIIELWNPSSYRFVRYIDTSVNEVVSYTSKVVPRLSIFQKFQDDIIASSHPICAVTRHGVIPEEPGQTLFGARQPVSMIRHIVQSSPQTLIMVANLLDITADASLPWASFTRENGCAAVSPARTARRSTQDRMQSNPLRGDKTPERSDSRTESLPVSCPVCGCLIDGLAADDRTTIEPCGHSAAGLTTTSMTTDTTSDANRVMTDGSGETVLACPECDGTGLERRSGGPLGLEPIAPYYCKRCSTAVEEPVERERYKDPGGLSGLAGKLEDADPDDVGRPMTDGGQPADPGEQVPAEDKFNDVVSMITSEYAAISIKTELMRCEVSGSDDDAPELGLTVIQDGPDIGLSAGTNNREFGQTPDIHTHHGLTREQARELRDGLDRAIQNAESGDGKYIDSTDPKGLVERLKAVFSR